MRAKSRPPVLTIHYRDQAEDWEAIMSVDSLVGGCAGGGVRVSTTVDAREVMGLARVMTLKNKALNLPIGGVKYGLRFDPTSKNKLAALTRFFEHVRPICESMCGFGPDMNTTAAELDEVARKIGLPSRHVALAKRDGTGEEGLRRYHSVLEERVGPLKVLELRTGVGVAAATERAAEVLGLEPPLSVAVQGFGQVGSGTAWFLHQAGHRIVAVADLGGTYADPAGLDVPALIAARANGMIDRAKMERFHRGPPEGILATECDALVLAADSFAIDKENASAVGAKLVIEGGNLAVTPDAETVLHSRGIPTVPDFLANGGAIASCVGIIRLGWDPEPTQLLARLREHIGQVVRDAADSARKQRLTIRRAAVLGLDEPLELK